MKTTVKRTLIQKIAALAIILCTVVIAFLAVALRNDLPSASAHLTVTPTDCHFCPALGDDPDYGGFGNETALTSVVYCKTPSGQNIPMEGVQVNYTYQEYYGWYVGNGTVNATVRNKTISKATDARGVANIRPQTTVSFILNSHHPSNGAVSGFSIPYPVVTTQPVNVPSKIRYNNLDYTVRTTGPVTNPDCATGLLDPLVAGPYAAGKSKEGGVSAPTATQSFARARPACRYFPNGLDGNPATDDRKFVCMDQASYGLWYSLCSNPGGHYGGGDGGPDCGPNLRMWMNVRKSALSCGGTAIYSGWSPRSYVSTYQNFFVGKSAWGTLGSLNRDDQIRAQWYRRLAQLYGGIIDLPLVAHSGAGTVFTFGGTEPTDAENNNVRLPLPHYAAPFTTSSNYPRYDWARNLSIPHGADTLRTDTVIEETPLSAPFETYRTAKTLVPKFEYTCTPAAQVTTKKVRIYDSEVSPCPAGAICNDPVQSGNKLVSSNTPIHVGTFDNANNARRCTGQLDLDGNCTGGAWEYIGRDMNPFEAEFDISVLGDTDQNGNQVAQPYTMLRNSTVAFQQAGANVPTDPNNIKFTIGFNGSAMTNATGVQCLQPNGASTVLSGTFGNCMSNPNCAGCAELRRQNGQNFTVITEVGAEGTASRPRTVRFRYMVAFRDPSGAWQAGNKNIFVNPTTSVPNTFADFSNNGWQMTNNNGDPCKWSTTWDCGPGAGVLAFDVTPPTGTLSVTEDQTLAANQMRYNVVMSDADTLGYFGRLARRCRNNSTPCQAFFMNYTLPLRGNDYNGGRGAVPGQWSSISGSTYSAIISGAEGGDRIESGIWLFDRASNSRWIRAGDARVQAPWLKTSLGDVYSYGGSTGFNLQMSGAYAAEDQEIENRFINAPFRAQRSTLSGFWLGTNAADFGVTGGWQNSIQGFEGNYNNSRLMQTRYDDYNNTALFSLDPQRYANSGVFGWYENIYQLLLDATTQNCQALGASSCQPVALAGSGDVRSNLQSTTAPYKFITLNGGNYSIPSGTRCTGVNTIFLTNSAKVTIDNDLLATNNISGCLFVLDGNSATKVTLADSQVANGNTYGLATTGGFTDVVEAGFILERAAQLETQRGTLGSDNRFDRLILRGFIFAATNNPVLLQRDLALRDNRNYPAEWIMYDTRSIDLYRTISGDNRSITITCTGDLQHPECNSPSQ